MMLPGIEVTWINGVRGLRPVSMEKYFQELARALRTLAPGEVHITVDEIEGIPLPALRGIVNRYIFYSLKNLRRPAGLYHALDNVNAHILRLLPAGATKVLTVHDIYHLKTPFYRVGDLPLKLGHRSGLRVADAVVAISEVTRDELAEWTGYPRERIRVIYDGIDHEVYKPAPLASTGEPPYILYVGSEQPRKNISCLLRVLNEVRGEGIGLKKAGRPEGEALRRHTLEEARLLGVEDSMELLGYVDEEKLATLYRGALALVMPSLSEGFGMPIIEAMACGCPVICSDIPTFREVTGGAALLFSPEDHAGMAEAALRLAGDRGFRTSQVSLGLERARYFSWGKCAAEHLRLYRELAEEAELQEPLR